MFIYYIAFCVYCFHILNSLHILGRHGCVTTVTGQNMKSLWPILWTESMNTLNVFQDSRSMVFYSTLTKKRVYLPLMDGRGIAMKCGYYELFTVTQTCYVFDVKYILHPIVFLSIWKMSALSYSFKSWVSLSHYTNYLDYVSQTVNYGLLAMRIIWTEKHAIDLSVAAVATELRYQ